MGHRRGSTDAQMGDEAQIEPNWVADWDETAQPAPDFEVDQRQQLVTG